MGAVDCHLGPGTEAQGTAPFTGPWGHQHCTPAPVKPEVTSPAPEGWCFFANAQWDSAPTYSLAPQLCAERRLCRHHGGCPAHRWERNQVGCGRQRGGEALSSLEPPLTLPSWEGSRGQRAGSLGWDQQPLTPPAAALRDPEAWAERAAGDSGTCRASPRLVGGDVCPFRGSPPRSGSQALTSVASINCRPACFWLPSRHSQ